MHPELDIYLQMQIRPFIDRHFLNDSSDLFIFFNMFLDKLEAKETALRKKGASVFLYSKLQLDSVDFVFEAKWDGGNICVKGFELKTKQEVKSLWRKIQDLTIGFD